MTPSHPDPCSQSFPYGFDRCGSLRRCLWANLYSGLTAPLHRSDKRTDLSAWLRSRHSCKALPNDLQNCCVLSLLPHFTPAWCSNWFSVSCCQIAFESPPRGLEEEPHTTRFPAPRPVIASQWKIRARALCKLLISLSFAHKEARPMPDCCALCIIHGVP